MRRARWARRRPSTARRATAFAFDGASYLTIPYAADLDSTAGFTVTMRLAIDGFFLVYDRALSGDEIAALAK